MYVHFLNLQWELYVIYILTLGRMSCKNIEEIYDYKARLCGNNLKGIKCGMTINGKLCVATFAWYTVYRRDYFSQRQQQLHSYTLHSCYKPVQQIVFCTFLCQLNWRLIEGNMAGMNELV